LASDEIRVVLQEQIRHVVQMHQAVQFRRTQPVFLAQLVTEQSGGFGDIMDEMRVLRLASVA
jgi:hypothetical protein